MITKILIVLVALYGSGKNSVVVINNDLIKEISEPKDKELSSFA